MFIAPSVNDVQQAIEYIFPLVFEFRKERTKEDENLLAQKKAQGQKRKLQHTENEDSFEEEGSDESWD